MTISPRYTSADLELLPDVEGTRYEIIDGDLHVSKQPRWEHQYACDRVSLALQLWSDETQRGLSFSAPGLIFAADDDVAPDIVWVSRERLPKLLDDAGHLAGAPELVVEVLSPGAANERRDRELKLKLYSRQGVHEYWIVDWVRQTVQVYRREQAALKLVATLETGDELQTPLLPGFRCAVSSLWPPAITRSRGEGALE